MGKPDAARKHVALTSKALSAVSASMDTMATENTTATIKTSAIVGLVAGTQFAETPTALTLVNAIPVFMVTAFHAMTRMSVNGETTIVIRKLHVLILGDHLDVLARKDITETAGSVKARKLRLF